MASERLSAKAIVSHGSLEEGQWRMEDVRLRNLREDELLVDIIATGVCHTDVLFGSEKEGSAVIYPSVKGHEGEKTSIQQESIDSPVAKMQDKQDRATSKR